MEPFSPIEEALEDVRQGKMIVIVDDEDRENEGDLMVAAEKATPEFINFMARFGRGLICLTLTGERTRELGLSMMVEDNQSAFETPFTISIDARQGVTTGISAADRAKTVRTAVAKNALAEDLVQPGHIFPLVAKPGGVLKRAGHTEAGVDLARMAGLAPAAVIVEIMNPDGTMARRPDLETFAKQHDLKIGTIADLIQYRSINEKTVECVNERKVETEFGQFNLRTYLDRARQERHFALNFSI